MNQLDPTWDLYSGWDKKNLSVNCPPSLVHTSSKSSKLLSDCPFKSSSECVQVFQFTLPHDSYNPAEALGVLGCRFVPSHILAKFFSPEFDAGLRRIAEFAAIVAMPKAAVYLNDSSPLGKNAVRFSGKSCCVEPKSKAVDGANDRRSVLDLYRMNVSDSYSNCDVLSRVASTY